jgi:hypothetical protein
MPNPPRPGTAVMCCGTPASPVTCTCGSDCGCKCDKCKCKLTRSK